MDKKRENNVELKKHTASIHCSNTLSLLQRKISNALLYYAYPRLIQQEEHIISIKQLCLLIGYNGNNDKVIKSALKKLISTVLEWNVVDDVTKKENWTASSILASVQIQKGLCQYAYSPRLRELFYNPSMYGKINLFIQSRFTSTYGLALYENCTRYKGLSHTKKVGIDKFRKIMGVPDDKYKVFRDFKRRVLDKAVEEVNTHSDLFIAPVLERHGKKAIAITFTIKTREKKARLGTNLPRNEGSLLEEESIAQILLSDFGLKAEQIREMLSIYDMDYIQEKITLIQSSNSYLAGEIRNLASYLLNALKKDFQKPTSSDAMLRVKRMHKEQAQERGLAEEREEEQKKAGFNEICDTKIVMALEKLAQEAKTAFFEGFQTFLENPANKLALDAYKKHNLDSRIVKAYLRMYVKADRVDLVKLPTLEEFKRKDAKR